MICWNLCCSANSSMANASLEARGSASKTLSVLLKAFDISHNSWEQASMERRKWWTDVRIGAKSYEANRIAADRHPIP
ncbi:hypothetical protein P5673_005259 [Acropora cervicornis]|uniref:Uncharacterized protein n=1 Tax=Acropora cervicornis TaxID=6130 RepID=A0AAD9QZP5_ACRCE|nr:hypothetical protein P5673_005259 [Acropora cervicornis]